MFTFIKIISIYFDSIYRMLAPHTTNSDSEGKKKTILLQLVKYISRIALIGIASDSRRLNYTFRRAIIRELN